MKAAAWGALALICAVFMFLTVNLARASEEMTCKPAQEGVDLILQNAEKMNAKPLAMIGDKAQKFLRVVNAEPPETDFKADALLVLMMPDDIALVFLLTKADNKICGYISISPKVFAEAYRAAGYGGGGPTI